jgi:phosphocarrier protein
LREITVEIQNQEGLHTRPAAQLVRLTSCYASDIWLVKDGFTVNAKSIIGVMTLAAEHGSSLILRANGNDEENALRAIATFFNSGFEPDTTIPQCDE